MSCLSVITKPVKTASILSLFVPSQNGVIQGSLHYTGAARGAPSSGTGEITPKTDHNQPGNVSGSSSSSDTPPRPKVLVCTNGKMEKNRGLAALNIEEDIDEGSLPCTPELPSTPDYDCPSEPVLDLETRQLIEGFLREHTGLCESRWRKNQSKSLSTMKRVVADVMDKHRLAYNGMISKLGLDERGDDMSIVAQIAKQIFSDGTTNWGRIVSLVAFGAVVCQHQKNSGREHCVELVGQEISNYLLSDQRDWMVKNNSWEGFVEFFHVSDTESSVRNTLMAFAGVAGIGATLALLIR